MPEAKATSELQKALHKLGLARDIDLALHIPLRYEDETRIVKLRDAREGDTVQIEATVTDSQVQYRPRRQLVVTVDDGSDTCVLRFFSFYPSQQKALAVGARLRGARRCPYGTAQRVVVVAFDGVMIPTPDGHKEARVGVVYEPDWNCARTPAAEAGLHKEYFATTDGREELVREVCARALARSAGAVVPVIGDGSALDWVELDPYLPHRVEILDLYHVLERVGEIAKLRHPDAGAAGAWRAEMKQELLQFGPRKLLEALRQWEPEAAVAREVRRVQLAYFERQQERMQYPEYLRRGYPVGSGAVEGACKHLVVDRFRRSGMRWKPETADPVMRIRAAILTQPQLDLRQFAATKAVSVVA